MKGKRYTTEQKIRILREAEEADATIIGVCQARGISEQTFHRWKREFGMMELDQAKQLKELQKENARLKRMLADEMLGKELLKEALEKKWQAPVTNDKSPSRWWIGADAPPERRAGTSDCTAARLVMRPRSPMPGWRS